MTFDIPAGQRASLRTQADRSGQSAATAVLPQGLNFTGDASFPGDIVIEGSVRGNITAPRHATAHLIDGGTLEGTLDAGNARIDGQLQGSINCPLGLVEFGTTARCEVDVTYAEMDVARGSNVQATLRRAAGDVNV